MKKVQNKYHFFSIPDPDKRITVRELLQNRAREYAEKAFLFDPEKERQYSYLQFYESVNTVSNFLWKQGVRKDDKVSLLMSNSAEYLLALFGIMQIGAVACPINTHLKAEEIEYILQNSDSIALFISHDLLHVTHRLSAWGDEKVRYLLTWDHQLMDTEKIISEINLPLLNLVIALKKEPLELLPEILEIALEPDNLAEIIYTSGTTGRPKGAMLTHHNLIIDSCWIAYSNRLQEKDRAMCVMPLFHVNGQIVTVMTPLYHGGSTVIPQRFSVTRFFPLIEKYRVTYVGSVATMLSMLLNRAAVAVNSDDSSLKIVFCGSAPVPSKVQVEFEKTFKVPVIEGYGMTETTCRSTFNPLPPPDALQLGKNDGYRKIGSVGIPLGNEIKVVDESHNPLGPNEVGEIVIRGENVMKGYYKNAEATKKAFSEGWFHSGDLGYYDEEGYFFIVDRKIDMIIRGGENIYPREIEELLYKHPAVKDAACIGVPDELYGEEVVAFITLKENKKEGEKEIVTFCRKYLADFKCPKQIMIMEEIPKSSSGKLLRRELREIWNRNT
ncbi:MAG: class I adenylate-forming enzyme family protein [Bacillota bacterium]|nr:class I adenylate-forming enzyme family protein [Bacillota bacterium]